MVECQHGRRGLGGVKVTLLICCAGGGRHGIDIIPGDSAKSPLIHYVARLVEDLEMPPDGKGEPLTRDQIALLRAWIDAPIVGGAHSGQNFAVGGSPVPQVEHVRASGLAHSSQNFA